MKHHGEKSTNPNPNPNHGEKSTNPGHMSENSEKLIPSFYLSLSAKLFSQTSNLFLYFFISATINSKYVI